MHRCCQCYQSLETKGHIPGNSHPNRTVKANAIINSKQTTLKDTDNYVYTYLLTFISLFYIALHLDDSRVLTF